MIANVYKRLRNITETQLTIVWVDRLDKLERRTISALRAYFSRQQRDYVRQYKETEKIDFKIRDYDLELSHVLHPHVVNATNLGFKRFKLEYDQTDGAGIKGKVTVSPDWQTVQDILTYDSLLKLGTLIKSINETTRREIQSIVKDGLHYGYSAQEIAARIAQKFDKFKSIRTLTIARTELSRAANYAYLKSGESLGMTQKRWLTALDEFVCPICSSLNGKIVPVKGSFSMSLIENDGTSKNYTADQPPAHPNCRCTLLVTTPAEVAPLQIENVLTADRPKFSRDSLDTVLNELGLNSNDTDPLASAWEKWKHGMQMEVRNDLMSDTLATLSPLEKALLKMVLDKMDGDYTGDVWRGIVVDKFNDAKLAYLTSLHPGDIVNMDLRGWTTDFSVALDFSKPISNAVKAGFIFHIEKPAEGSAYFFDRLISNALDHEAEVLVKPMSYRVIDVTRIGKGKQGQPIYQIDLEPNI